MLRSLVARLARESANPGILFEVRVGHLSHEYLHDACWFNWVHLPNFPRVHPLDPSLSGLYAEDCAGHEFGQLFLVVDQAQAMAGRQFSISSRYPLFYWHGDDHLRWE